MRVTCDTCLYWQEYDREDGIGLCWRYPPRIVGNFDDDVRPSTCNNHWCGEWKVKSSK